MVIFHCYVSSPEGIWLLPTCGSGEDEEEDADGSMEEDEVEKPGQNLKTDQIQSLTRRSMDLDKWEYLCSPLEHSVFDVCQYDMLIYHIYMYTLYISKYIYI